MCQFLCLGTGHQGQVYTLHAVMETDSGNDRHCLQDSKQIQDFEMSVQFQSNFSSGEFDNLVPVLHTEIWFSGDSQRVYCFGRLCEDFSS